jgi:FMN-dependent NADH-azoreductase
MKKYLVLLVLLLNCVCAQESLNILVITAHDKADSLNLQVANYLMAYLTSYNHHVDWLDLYHHELDIPFFKHDSQEMEKNPFFQLNKEKIMAADRLVIVFPTYWYSMPGILKCWVDLITNYAWQFDKPTRAKAKHAISNALLINTRLQSSDRSPLVDNPALKQMHQTLSWIDIPEIITYEIGYVYDMNELRYEQHLSEISKMANALMAL